MVFVMTTTLRHSPKPKRERSPSYLKSAVDEPCWVCGKRDGTIVFAHKRRGQTGGIGLKPPDWCGGFLCATHHAMEHDGSANSAWVWDKVGEYLMRERYEMWRTENA